MDNITHSLAGLVVGEIAARCLHRHAALGETESSVASGENDRAFRRRLFLTVSLAANNFPDLDLILTPLLPAPLGYLLHHRGHTHTLIWLLPQAAVIFLALLLWPRAREEIRRDRRTRWGLALVVPLGFLAHFALDALNSYGLHPFYPFDNRWFFGDLIFIIEPLFWCALGASWIATLATRRRRAAASMGLALPILLFAFLGFLRPLAVLFLATLSAGLYVWQRRSSQGVLGLVAALALVVGYTALQSRTANEATRVIRTAIAERDPGARWLDVTLNPVPTHPLCWTFITVQTETRKETQILRQRSGLLSIAPGITEVADCPLIRRAEYRPLPDGDIIWLGDDTTELRALWDQSTTNCLFNAWMRFARNPSLNAERATDLRFVSQGKTNFTTLPLREAAKTSCPEPVPPWTPPRLDLFKPTGRAPNLSIFDSVFLNATRVEAFLVEPTFADHSSAGLSNAETDDEFNDHAILAAGPVLTTEQVSRLRSLLNGDGAMIDSSMNPKGLKTCVLDGRYAIRVSASDQRSCVAILGRECRQYWVRCGANETSGDLEDHADETFDFLESIFAAAEGSPNAS